jgi:hypothetical protein
LAFQFGNARRGILPLGLELFDIETIYHTAPIPRPANPDRLIPGLQRALGDLQLKVELAQIEVGLSHVSYKL